MAMKPIGFKNYLFVLIYCIVFAHLSEQQQNPPPQQQPTYGAVVAEMATSSGSDHDKITNIHTQNICSLILSDVTQSADILVYPEGALNTVHNSIEVPLPQQNVVPCDSNANYSLILRNISCAAREARKYVVVNLYMRTNCSEEAIATNDTRPCTRPNENINVYSTTVVFNRNGTIIARYRKFNVFNQTEIRAPISPEAVSFTTDFNVSFGLLTSMDIFFERPARRLLEQGIRHFILPSMWSAELPFLTANQMQLAWSYANNVTLLASGISNPHRGYTGSGIYSGSIGALTVVQSEIFLMQILQANLTYSPGVPREDSAPQVDPSFNDDTTTSFQLRSEDLNEYGVELLAFNTNLTQIGRHCHGSFCCAFNIQATNLGEVNDSVFYRYAVVYYNGTREHSNLPNIHTGITVCAVVACTGDNRNTCNSRFIRNNTPNLHNRYRFDRLELSVEYPAFTHSRSTVMPSTLTRAMLPFTIHEFIYTEMPAIVNNQTSIRVSMLLQRSNANFLTFGIYSRDYALDQTSGADKTLTGILLIAFGIILNFIY